MREFSIKEVIAISMETYKEHWRVLVTISLISVMISQVISLANVIVLGMEISPVQIMLTLLISVISFVSLYYTFRLSVAMILAAYDVLSDEEVTVSGSYDEAKKLTWRYIGITLLVGVIMIVPYMLVMLPTMPTLPGFNIPLYMSIPLAIIGAVAGVYLFTLFVFSSFIAVLEPEEKNVLTRSKTIAQTQFYKVMLMVLVMALWTGFNMFLGSFVSTLSSSAIIGYLLSVLVSVPGVFIAPIITLITIVSMYTIENDDVVLEVTE